MNILANIIGAAVASIIAAYENVYTDENYNYYVNNDNEPYTQ